MDVLTEAVAKPKGAVLKFGLPKWKAMSLEHKIPMIPNAPKDTYNLTRCKLGRKLWTIGPKAEFDLSDPYCRETNFAYEPLHDEHLLGFFSKPANIKYLLNADLITEDLHVKCTLRDYNAYRQYLRKIHVNDIRKELRRRNQLFVEQRALRRTDDQARKEAIRLEKKVKLTDVRQLIAQQREARFRMQKERERKVTQRLKLSKLIRQERWRLINAKREELYERMQQKCKLAQRRKVIGVSMERKRKERARARTREKRLVNAERQKRKDMEERWKRKRDFQERDIAEQKVLLQCLNTRRQVFITDYNDRIKKEKARMEKLLENTKLFTNCYIRRYLPDGRRRICCGKYLRIDADGKDEEKRESWRSTYRSRELVKSKEAKVVKVKLGQNLRQKGKPVHTESGKKHIVKKDDYNKVKKHEKIGKLMIEESLTERKIKVSQPSVTWPKIEPTEAAFGKHTTLMLENTRQCRCHLAKPTNSVSTNTIDRKTIEEMINIYLMSTNNVFNYINIK